jgi:hypothetical protein
MYWPVNPLVMMISDYEFSRLSWSFSHWLAIYEYYSETESVFVLRWRGKAPTQLGPLERPNHRQNPLESTNITVFYDITLSNSIYRSERLRGNYHLSQSSALKMEATDIFSTFGLATGYGLHDRGVGVRISVGSRIFSSTQSPWGPSSLVFNGYRG